MSHPLIQFAEAYTRNPSDAEETARHFGLWDPIREMLSQPLRMELCRRDYNHFIEYVFVDPETGGYLEQQPFHREWQHLIATRDHVLIIAPRGHGKTVQVVGRVVWELGNNPNLRVKIIGSSDDKAKEIIGLIHEVIESSERCHEVFPNLRIDVARGDTKTAFFVERPIFQRDPSVEASGVLSTGAGGRADLLICDDVVDLKNSIINPAQREQVKRAVKETWFALVAATGRIVWICTPYHVADASHDIKNNSGDLWAVWMCPAIKTEIHYNESTGEPLLDAEGKPLVTRTILWPDKWNEEKLKEEEELIGTRVFARQFLLNAMSDEERTFPEISLEKSFDRTLADIGDQIEEDWPTFGGVDLASALGKKAAWTVIWTLARSPYNGKLHFKRLIRRRMPFSETIQVIRNEYKAQRWRVLYVENNQYQQAVINALEEAEQGIPVYPFVTGINKANELIGLPGMNVAFEKGHFAIPAARFPLGPEEVSPLSIVMDELRTHPGGEFSDTIMALWFAWSAALKGGGDFDDAYLQAVAA